MYACTGLSRQSISKLYHPVYWVMYWDYPALSGKLLANMLRIWICHHIENTQPNQQSLKRNIPCLCSSQPCHREQMLSLQDRPWQLHLKHLHLQSKQHTQTHKHSLDLPCSSNTKKTLKALNGTMSTKLKATTCVILFTDLIDWLLIFHKRFRRGKRHDH